MADGGGPLISSVAVSSDFRSPGRHAAGVLCAFACGRSNRKIIKDRAVIPTRDP
jgi:hypothetical protein